MPRIFDNIATDLLPALRDTLQISQRSDFCVGYFNLRGWKAIDSLIEQWAGGEGAQCRLIRNYDLKYRLGRDTGDDEE
jgi:hypothetical protein